MEYNNFCFLDFLITVTRDFWTAHSGIFLWVSLVCVLVFEELFFVCLLWADCCPPPPLIPLIVMLGLVLELRIMKEWFLSSSPPSDFSILIMTVPHFSETPGSPIAGFIGALILFRRFKCSSKTL